MNICVNPNFEFRFRPDCMCVGCRPDLHWTEPIQPVAPCNVCGTHTHTSVAEPKPFDPDVMEQEHNKS